MKIVITNKCKYRYCNNTFEPKKSGNRIKKYCCADHNHAEWILNNHERRLMHITKYERKMGAIPREKWIKKMEEKRENYSGNAYRTNIQRWKILATKVKQRDNNECQLCGIIGRKGLRMTVHHIIPYDINPEDKIENLITLCNSCHIKIEWKIRKEGDFVFA